MRLEDSTQPWTPNARLKELYSKQKIVCNTTSHNHITNPLFKHSPGEVGWCVPIRIDLISALSQTEFNICSNMTAVSLLENPNRKIDQEGNSINRHIGSMPVMLAVSASEKWKGGIKNIKTSKISDSGEMDFRTASALTSKHYSIGATGSAAVTGKDSENRNWTLESDLHSVSLRFSLFFQDISKIPSNHLR